MNKQRYCRGRKRTEFVAFYVTKEEKENICENARRQDVTLSDYCRRMLINDSAVKAVFGEK